MTVAEPLNEVVAVRYGVPRWSPAWAIPEVPVPASDTHDAAVDYIRALLVAWVQRTFRNAKVARNLGIRWVPEEPRMGFDPDVCLIEPAPPPDEPLSVLKTWLPDHAVPRLAIEVVSPGHPYKDYIDTPDRAAACGIRELWIYDPMMAGPRAHGGPWLLQIWHQTGARTLERIAAGTGPVFSGSLGAWLVPRAGKLPSEAKLIIASTPDGPAWRTAEEEAREAAQREREAAQREREAAQREREAAQREREARQRAEERVEALERELKGRAGR